MTIPASVPPVVARPPGEPGPAVAVCLAVGDLRPVVDPRTGTVSRDTAGIGLAPPDTAALEIGLRLAGPGGRVTALTVGPAEVDPVLAEVAALGVDVLRVPAPDPRPAVDEWELARILAAVLGARGPVDLVLCGDRSVDRGTGALPALLAHELGAAQALGLVALEHDHASGAGGTTPVLRGVRRLDGGWREHLDIPLPAVCSMEGGVRLRRAPLSGALTAATAPIPAEPMAVRDRPATTSVHVEAARPFRPPAHPLPAPSADDPRLRLLTLTGVLETPEPPAVVGSLSAAEAANRLLAFVDRARDHGETS